MLQRRRFGPPPLGLARVPPRCHPNVSKSVNQGVNNRHLQRVSPAACLTQCLYSFPPSNPEPSSVVVAARQKTKNKNPSLLCQQDRDAMPAAAGQIAITTAAAGLEADDDWYCPPPLLPLVSPITGLLTLAKLPYGSICDSDSLPDHALTLGLPHWPCVTCALWLLARTGTPPPPSIVTPGCPTSAGSTPSPA